MVRNCLWVVLFLLNYSSLGFVHNVKLMNYIVKIFILHVSNSRWFGDPMFGHCCPIAWMEKKCQMRTSCSHLAMIERLNNL